MRSLAYAVCGLVLFTSCKTRGFEKSGVDSFKSSGGVIFAVEPDHDNSINLLCVYSVTPGTGNERDRVRAVVSRPSNNHFAISEDSFSRLMFRRLFGEVANVPDLESITVEMISRAQGDEKKRLGRAVLYSRFLQFAATSAVATGVGLAVFSPPGINALVGYYTAIFADTTTSKLVLTALTAVWGSEVIRELATSGGKARGETVALGAIAWTLTYAALFVAPPALAMTLPSITYVNFTERVKRAVDQLKKFKSEELSDDDIRKILDELRRLRQNILSRDYIEVNNTKMAQIEFAAMQAEQTNVVCPTEDEAWEQHSKETESV